MNSASSSRVFRTLKEKFYRDTGSSFVVLGKFVKFLSPHRTFIAELPPWSLENIRSFRDKSWRRGKLRTSTPRQTLRIGPIGIRNSRRHAGRWHPGEPNKCNTYVPNSTFHSISSASAVPELSLVLWL